MAAGIEHENNVDPSIYRSLNVNISISEADMARVQTYISGLGQRYANHVIESAGAFASAAGEYGVATSLIGGGSRMPTASPGQAQIDDVAGFGARATESGPSFYRGAKPGDAPSFEPRPNDFKVDPATGAVKPTHGVSVFDNPGSVTSKGFVPHEVDLSSVPPELRIVQRGADPAHFEIMPQVGADLTPEQYGSTRGRGDVRF